MFPRIRNILNFDLFKTGSFALVLQATCGGCHMVVLARPRDGGSGDVTLEEEDVIEYILEKPYGEVLGCTLDSSTLNRSLSARVRRRERVRDEFVSDSVYIKWVLSLSKT